MAQKLKMYRKLSGSGFSMALKHSLWIGPDHLLFVESGIFREQYKRFYFKDIQALALHHTNRRILWALILGAFLLLFGAVPLFSKGPVYLSGSMAVVFVILLIVQWLKGPGCDVFLKTAVQTTKLSNLVRVRKAIKILDQIKAAAETAQGSLNKQGIASVQSVRIQSGASDEKAINTSVERLPRQAVNADKARYNPLLHRILFGLLTAAGILRGAQLWLKLAPLAIVDLLSLLCALMLAITVLVRWHGLMKGSLLSLASWISLIFSVVHILAMYGMYIASVMRSANRGVNTWLVVKMFFLLQTGGHPVIEAIFVGIALVSIGVGLLGLIATLTYEHNGRNR